MMISFEQAQKVEWSLHFQSFILFIFLSVDYFIINIIFLIIIDLKKYLTMVNLVTNQFMILLLSFMIAHFVPMNSNLFN